MTSSEIGRDHGMPLLDDTRSQCGQFDTGNTSPATVWRAPRVATEGGRLVAGADQGAFLDTKEPQVWPFGGPKSEIFT